MESYSSNFELDSELFMNTNIYTLNYENIELYRGDSTYLDDNCILPVNNIYLTFNKENAEIYGIVRKYQLNNVNLRIVLLDKNFMELLYNSENITENIKDILIKNFGLFNNIRYSVSVKDKELCNFIQSIGFDGYFNDYVNTDFGGKFHPEIVIFNSDNITFLEMITSKKKIDQLYEKRKLLNYENLRLESKKMNKNNNYTFLENKKKLFEFDLDF